jgi:hypothetical protein
MTNQTIIEKNTLKKKRYNEKKKKPKGGNEDEAIWKS